MRDDRVIGTRDIAAAVSSSRASLAFRKRNWRNRANRHGLANRARAAQKHCVARDGPPYAHANAAKSSRWCYAAIAALKKVSMTPADLRRLACCHS